MRPARTFLTDFGVATVPGVPGTGSAPSATRLTATGAGLGTPAYTSPKQARGSAPLTPASDVWSLGCVRYELLAGRPPFVADTIAECEGAPAPTAAEGR